MSTKLIGRNIGLQQTRQQLLPQLKIAQFLVKIRVSQPDGLQAAMITIFCTQVLDLNRVRKPKNRYL